MFDIDDMYIEARTRYCRAYSNDPTRVQGFLLTSDHLSALIAKLDQLKINSPRACSWLYRSRCVNSLRSVIQSIVLSTVTRSLRNLSISSV